jgi:hypothetical protein
MIALRAKRKCALILCRHHVATGIQVIGRISLDALIAPVDLADKPFLFESHRADVTGTSLLIDIGDRTEIEQTMNLTV